MPLEFQKYHPQGTDIIGSHGFPKKFQPIMSCRLASNLAYYVQINNS